MNRHAAQGIFLGLIALGFGVQARGYAVGTLAHFGPGFFPLAVSGMLLLVALGMLVRAARLPREVLRFDLRNIGIVVVALGAFVAVTTLVNMAAAIIVLVFTATAAGQRYSVRMNAGTSAVLIGIALLFEHLLHLPLKVL